MRRPVVLNRVVRSLNAAVIVAVLATLSLPATGRAGVLYEVTPIGLENSYAFGINNYGEVVGTVSDTSGFSRSFLYSGGAITYLPSLGGSSNQGRAINDSGVIAGLTSTRGNDFRAFEYKNGILRTLGVTSYAFGINESGQIVGYAQTTSGDQHAFLYNNSNDTVTDLGTLGGNYSIALGINDSGQVVGSSRNASGEFRAFQYSGGAMTDLGTLGGNSGNAQAINNLGQIVGSSSIASGDSHAFLYSGGAMTDLGTLGGNFSIATAINEIGQIVGYSNYDTSYSTHAFLYSSGKMVNLNSLIDPASGWTIENATGIDDSGTILARAYRAGSGPQAVLLTRAAVPEPSGMILVGTGLSCLGLAVRRRVKGHQAEAE